MGSQGSKMRRPSVRRAAPGVDSGRSLALGLAVIAVLLVLAVAGIVVTCTQQPNDQPADGVVTDVRDESEPLEGDDDDDAADEDIVSQYLFAQGLDATHVAAIMGNIRQESGFEPNACDGKYYGLFMLSGDRFEFLYAYAQAKGTAWSDTRTQIEFAYGELSGGGEAADYAAALDMYLAGYGTALDAFKAYESVDDATEYFALAYERCVGGSDYSAIASELTSGKYTSLQQLSKRQLFAASYYEGFTQSE
ncbi:phage tail tip lysozyme [Denitrobacterium detoxificans]|uniref:phage tail tip lysozyme n=1 Tax=Denitrobacterium detoxificans TaxID=79604 RepID=UPI0012E830B1|nr:phage tail tip lysozyme [Denitrobacterium detoxificans]